MFFRQVSSWPIVVVVVDVAAACAVDNRALDSKV